MAASPQFKVYIAGEYVGCAKHPIEAAAMLACRGAAGDTIRQGHSKVVWTEGVDGEAGDSYDAVAEQVWGRVSG